MKCIPIAGFVLMFIGCCAVVRGQQPCGGITLQQQMLKAAAQEKMNAHSSSSFSTDQRAERIASVSDGRVSESVDSVDEGEVSLAYNPGDSNQLVLSYMSHDNFQFPVYYSSDGGSSWTKSSFNTLTVRSTDFPDRMIEGFGDPAFAWDKNGTVYMSWIYIERLTSTPLSDSLYWTISWAYSTDMGHTWQLKTNHFIGQGIFSLMTGTAYNYKDGVCDRGWLAVDNSGGPHQGNLYCSFVCYPPDGSATYLGLRAKLPGADTFNAAVRAYTGSVNFVNVDVGVNGALNISMADVGLNKVKYAGSIDGGAMFSTATVVSAAANLQPFTGHLIHRRENSAVNMCTDGNGGTGNNVHVVWSDFPGSTINSFYSHSTDGGLTWSPRLSLDTLMPGLMTLMPTVAANGNNVSISYTGISANDTANYYQLNSADNGVTFGTPTLLSSSPCNYHALGAASNSSPLFFGDYNRSVRTQCMTFASWEDCRNGITSKVYFSRTNNCALGIPDVSSVNSDAQLLSVFPNPASEQMTLKIRSSGNQPASVTLTDIAGRQQFAKTYDLHAGTHEIVIPLHDLSSGMYIVTLRDEAGIIATRSVVCGR